MWIMWKLCPCIQLSQIFDASFKRRVKPTIRLTIMSSKRWRAIRPNETSRIELSNSLEGSFMLPSSFLNNLFGCTNSFVWNNLASNLDFGWSNVTFGFSWATLVGFNADKIGCDINGLDLKYS